MKDLTVRQRKIIAVIENYSGYSLQELRGKSRTSDYVRARHILCYVLHEYAGMSYKSVGRVLNRDHSTAIHSHTFTKNVLNQPSDEDYDDYTALSMECGNISASGDNIKARRMIKNGSSLTAIVGVLVPEIKAA